MIGGGVVGGGVGGIAKDGTTEHLDVTNVISSIAMSPLTLLPRTASNTTCVSRREIEYFSVTKKLREQ